MAGKTSSKINPAPKPRRSRAKLNPQKKGKTRKLPVNRRPYLGDKPGALEVAEHIPEAMFKVALAECGGIRAHAARALGLTRSAVTKRIHNNPHLQEFVRQVEAYAGDMVEGNILDLCADKDGAMLRFYADRKLKDRGYGLKLDFRDETPVDPLAEQRRAEAMRIVGAMIEQRARLGLPPLFARPAAPVIEGALNSPKPPAEEPTKPPPTKKSNGHG
jgi:hypothetical protein